jgi:hypothetical protein
MLLLTGLSKLQVQVPDGAAAGSNYAGISVAAIERQSERHDGRGHGACGQ